MEECAVCNEECDVRLSCSHHVHYECIANSGRARCPVCLHEPIELPPEHQDTFQRAVARNQRFTEEQNREAAEDIQRQEEEQPDRVRRPNYREIELGYQIRRWRQRVSNDYNVGHVIEEVGQLLYTTDPTSVVEADSRSVRLTQTGISLREIAIDLNMSVRELVNVLLTVLDE